jgi:S-formylglutathione hydrolase FrmB
VVIAAFIALLLVALVPWRWDKWRWRTAGRIISTVFAVIAVVAASGLAANSAGSFYPTLGSLIGTSPNPAEGTVADAGPNGDDFGNALKTVQQRGSAGHGSMVHLTIKGKRTHINRDADVYLPSAYTAADWAGVKFPVIEWIPHFPGEPRQVATLYGLPELLDQQIATHRMPPTVVIIPDPNGEPRLTHDTECVDSVGGSANDTYLSADVHSWAKQTLRIRTDRQGWAIAGWSSGGYCALNLAVRHPQWYATAASMSGYDATPDDLVTGDLFHGRKDIQSANDVSVNLRQHPNPLQLLACADPTAPDEVAALDRMRAAATPPEQLTTWKFPARGHNLAAVKAELPAVLNWISEQLGNPIGNDTPPPADSTTQEVKPWPLPDSGLAGSLHGTDTDL